MAETASPAAVVATLPQVGRGDLGYLMLEARRSGRSYPSIQHRAVIHGVFTAVERHLLGVDAIGLPPSMAAGSPVRPHRGSKLER
jgi:hypothetical protein